MRVNPFIYARQKGMQKVYKKLLAHPLFVSVYVVYYLRYARVARTFYIGLAPVCVSKLFEPAKDKTLKDAEKHTFLCIALIPLYNVTGSFTLANF